MTRVEGQAVFLALSEREGSWGFLRIYRHCRVRLRMDQAVAVGSEHYKYESPVDRQSLLFGESFRHFEDASHLTGKQGGKLS